MAQYGTVLAEAMREWRTQHQVRQQDLAGRLGITQAKVSQLESAPKAAMSLDLFVNICRVLQTTPNRLLDFRED